MNFVEVDCYYITQTDKAIKVYKEDDDSLWIPFSLIDRDAMEIRPRPRTSTLWVEEKFAKERELI